MKTEKIITMINNNKIEELKQLLTEELYAQQAPNKNIYKSILKLSKLAEKEQRQTFKGEITHTRPRLAGMFLTPQGNQALCNGAWGIIFNKKYEGLILAQEWDDIQNAIKLENVFPREDSYMTAEIDINKLNNDLKLNKNSITKIGNETYPTNQIINIYNCLEDCKILFSEKERPLLLKGNNGKGIILPYNRV